MVPEDWLRAQIQGEVVALVHSHPGGLPWLSEADRQLQVQSDLPWWLVCRGALHKFRCVPHLTGRRFDHGVTDCYTLFRDAYHLAGIEITESHLGKELLEKVELTEDNASRLEEFSKEWKDANDKWNAMWAVKIEQTKDGKHYVAGIGLSMDDTEEGKLSQFLVAANRIAFIDPANGNETPMFVAQGNQIFMNDVFLKRLTAPTITSGGNPPAFSLTPDGKLTAKNADISGSVNANSGTLSNVTIAENCTINGTLRAEKIVGDIVKAASAAFPRQRESSVDWPSGISIAEQKCGRSGGNTCRKFGKTCRRYSFSCRA